MVGFRSVPVASFENHARDDITEVSAFCSKCVRLNFLSHHVVEQLSSPAPPALGGQCAAPWPTPTPGFHGQRVWDWPVRSPVEILHGSVRALRSRRINKSLAKVSVTFQFRNGSMML